MPFSTETVGELYRQLKVHEARKEAEVASMKSLEDQISELKSEISELKSEREKTIGLVGRQSDLIESQQNMFREPSDEIRTLKSQVDQAQGSLALSQEVVRELHAKIAKAAGMNHSATQMRAILKPEPATRADLAWRIERALYQIRHGLDGMDSEARSRLIEVLEGTP